MPGVTIGNNCIVGAGSVVTKSIPDGECWAGNPARFISNITDYTKKMIKASETADQKELWNIVCQNRIHGFSKETNGANDGKFFQ